MKYEVWGLVSIILLCLLWSCRKEPTARGNETSPVGQAVPFLVTSLTAERSGDSLHLTIGMKVKNSSAATVILTPPAAQLWISPDKPAAPFIAPGLEPAVITAGAESETATHWWLAASDLSGSLELEIGGARHTVKSSDFFDFALLPENKTIALQFPQWRTP